MRFSRGGLVPSISGILTASSGSHRVTETPRAFLSGEGGLYLPPQALFHTHLCLLPAPGVFIYLFIYIYILAGPRGPEWSARCLGRLQWTDAERCSKNSLKISGSWVSAFYIFLGGNAVRFFSRIFFWRLSPLIFVLFRVLSVLGFFLGGFFAMNFGLVCPEFFRGGFRP